MEILERYLAFPIEQLPYIIVALIIAFTVHEFSHAYVAYKFGDPTAKKQGRLTLNPASHLDVFGTIMIFIAGFGWAKPVPVNYFYFKNRKLAGVLVSVAGPLSNLLVATIAMGIWFALYRFGAFTKLGDNLTLTISQFFNVLISLNVVLFIFNLLPIPPLDGYRVIEDIVPSEMRPKLIQWERYGIFFFLLVLITPIGDYIFPPIFNTIEPFIFQALTNMFALIFGVY